MTRSLIQELMLAINQVYGQLGKQSDAKRAPAVSVENPRLIRLFRTYVYTLPWSGLSLDPTAAHPTFLAMSYQTQGPW